MISAELDERLLTLENTILLLQAQQAAMSRFIQITIPPEDFVSLVEECRQDILLLLEEGNPELAARLDSREPPFPPEDAVSSLP